MKKKLILLVFASGIMISVFVITLAILQKNQVQRYDINNSDYGQPSNPASYTLSYPLIETRNDPQSNDATKSWAEYKIKGIKIKYPQDQLTPEEPRGPEIKFRNLKNTDFTYGLTMFVYDAAEYTSSMNFLENFIITKRGVIRNDIYQTTSLQGIEIAQIANYFNVDGDGFYDVATGIKFGDKGVILESAFISEDEYTQILNLDDSKNDFLYKLIITSLKSLDQTPADYFLKKPSQESVSEYKKANVDKNITL